MEEKEKVIEIEIERLRDFKEHPFHVKDDKEMSLLKESIKKDIALKLRETYGTKIKIFDNVIPLSVKAAETSAEGISIYSHSPKSKVSNAYSNLTQEVLSNEK